MYDKLLEIIKHFGIKNQQKKLTEEIHELNEAITTYEVLDDYIGSYADEKHHIAEELADCYVLLNQIKTYYDISSSQIGDIMDEKTERTLERIKEGYYDKKEEN